MRKFTKFHINIHKHTNNLVYSLGEEILTRGSVSSDLFLLVDGKAEVILSMDNDKTIDTMLDNRNDYGTSVTGSELCRDSIAVTSKVIRRGEFINELGRLLLIFLNLLNLFFID